MYASPSRRQIMPPFYRLVLKTIPAFRSGSIDTDNRAIHRELVSERADMGSVGPIPGFKRGLDLSGAGGGARAGVGVGVGGVVFPAGHPLSRNWKELDGMKFIANRLGDQIHDEDFLPIVNASRRMVRNTASILSLVRAGVGVTRAPGLANGAFGSVPAPSD